MVSRRAGLLHLKEGATVAYQRWSALDQTPPINQKRILALHGWLDNSNSYSYLGSHLARQGFDFVAIDVPGHGLSSHLHGGVHFLSYCVETIKMVLESLEWTKDEQKSNIIGHSMGAGISMIFHGTYPELVEKSVLIDQVSPLTHPGETAPEKLRNAIDTRQIVLSKEHKPKVYATFQDAVSARLRAVSLWPGDQMLSEEAATILMMRNAVSVSNPQDSVDTGDEHSVFKASMTGPVILRNDHRLMLPSYSYLSLESALSFADRISTPVYAIEAESRWPGAMVINQELVRNRLHEKGVLRHERLPGAHHLHLDPMSAGLVARNIASFLA